MGEGRANMLRTINRIHTGWQKQSLMYINEHIYVAYVKEHILS